MQEPRTIIRVNRRVRAQYCPSDTLLPKDGYLTDLSERGAGLLAREAHRDGERLTVSFSLPGEDGFLIATGLVRWSHAQSRWNDWHPVGMEWLPLEETTRQRLHRFLSRSIRTPPAAPARRAGAQKAPAGSWRAVRWWIMGGLLSGVLGGFWLLSIQPQPAPLQAILHERNAIIQQLEQQAAGLRYELDATQTHLRVTSGEVDGLAHQTHTLEGAAQQLTQDVTRFQESHLVLYQERDALIRKVLELELERTVLLQRSVPLDELQRVLREAIARHKEIAPPPTPSHPPPAPQGHGQREGNRGYVVREGHSTLPSAPRSVSTEE